MSIAPEDEVAKYDKLYRENPRYRMGEGRKAAVRKLLAEIQTADPGMLLDVGCGRGEAIDIAEELGYDPWGSDAAEEVCYPAGKDSSGSWAETVVCCMAWEQPWSAQHFWTVTCWDVLEHLPPEFVERTIKELGRVCGHRLLMSAASKPDIWDGVDLHISARPYPEWDALIRACLPDFEVRWRKDSPTGTSEVWEAIRK